MRRAAIVSPIRTGVGRFLGSLQPLNAEDLAAAVIAELVTRTGIDPDRIEDVIFAQGYPSGEAPCIGRWAALAANLPLHVAGSQVDRRCGSGVQAIANAAMMVQTGAADVVIAGGAESMSNVEYYTTAMRQGQRGGPVTLYDRLERGRVRSQPEARFGHISGMIETAENLATEYQISRQDADSYAARSQQRAAEAWRDGKFNQEIVRISVPQRKADTLAFAEDEGVRGDTSIDSLAKLKPLLADGIVTAGNASGINDGAAAVVLMSADEAKKRGVEPLARIVSWATCGVDPAIMGTGPIPASRKALEKAERRYTLKGRREGRRGLFYWVPARCAPASKRRRAFDR